jgi:hypothetical protein
LTRFCNHAACALEAIRQRASYGFRDGSDSRPAGLCLAHIVLSGPDAAAFVDLAADGVRRKRFFEHRREAGGGGQRRFVARRGSAKCGGELFDPADQGFHPLTIRLGVEVGAGEYLGPRGAQALERRGEAFIELRGAGGLDTSCGYLLLPAGPERADSCDEVRRRLLCTWRI